MSYTILYDRVGIKLQNNEVLLLFCYGASNCTMIDSHTGREVYERTWRPFNTNNPIMSARKYINFVNDFCKSNFQDDEYTFFFKSHNVNKSISVNDFRKTMYNSIKCAKYTVEEFVDKGNILYIAYNEHDYVSPLVTKNNTVKIIHTEEELQKYVNLCKNNHYPFLISMKNYKRKC